MKMQMISVTIPSMVVWAACWALEVGVRRGPGFLERAVLVSREPD